MEETCNVLVKRQRLKHQVQTAKWTRGTLRSSAGPCSQTPWCWPRRSDSPGSRNMKNIIIMFISDVYCVGKCEIRDWNSAWVYISVFFSLQDFGSRKKAEVTKKAEVVSMLRNLVPTWAPSHYKQERTVFLVWAQWMCAVSISTVFISEVKHWIFNTLIEE